MNSWTSPVLAPCWIHVSYLIRKIRYLIWSSILIKSMDWDRSCRATLFDKKLYIWSLWPPTPFHKFLSHKSSCLLSVLLCLLLRARKRCNSPLPNNNLSFSMRRKIPIVTPTRSFDKRKSMKFSNV